MNQSKLLRYGTVVLIIIFAIEIVAFLFTNNPYSGEFPSPSPTITPVPETFEGFNITDALVTGIGRELLILCNTTGDPGPKVRALEGVLSVSYDPQNTRLGVGISENASIDEVVSLTKDALKEFCTPRIYKRGFINAGNYLNVSASDGSGVFRVISGSSLACLQQSTFAQCYAFVQPETQQNDTKVFNIFVRTVGGAVTFVTAEEPRMEAPIQFKATQTKGIVLGFLEESTASAKVAWKDRALISETKIRAALNGSVNITEFQYEPQNEIEISNLTENDSAYGKLGELSFVRSVFPANGQVLVQVLDNFTDDDALTREFAALGITDGRYVIPDSDLELSFEYSEQAENAVRKAVSPIALEVRRKVLVELLNESDVELQLGGRLPQNTFELFALNSTLNSTLDLTLNAIVQDGEIGYITAAEADIAAAG